MSKTESQNFESSKIPNRRRWKEAAEKIKPAIIPKEHDLGKLEDAIIDSVKVQLDYDQYLEEIATGQIVTYDGVIKMLRMTSEQLHEHQVFYDASSQSLVDHKNIIATTIGKVAKFREDTQVFVMDKKGNLYIGNHNTILTRNKENITHASFLKGMPLEMAGTIKINEQGKINYISADSGHYVPDMHDMYRGIEKLQKLMPGVFTEDCIVSFFNSSKEITNLWFNDFMEILTKPREGRKSAYELERANLVSKHKNYKENLKKAVSIEIESNGKTDVDICDALSKLNVHQKKELETALLNPMVGISFRYSQEKIPYATNILDVIEKVVEQWREDSMQVLLDVGIINRPEFRPIKFLCGAIKAGHPEMARAILEQEIEVNVPDLSGVYPITFATDRGYTDIIKKLIKKGADIETLDRSKNTPLLLAIGKRNVDAVRVLLELGANPFAQRRWGESALELAKQSGNVDIEKLVKLAQAQQVKQTIESPDTTIKHGIEQQKEVTPNSPNSFRKNKYNMPSNSSRAV